MPVLNEFHKRSPALRVARLYAKVIKYKQVLALYLANLLQKTATWILFLSQQSRSKNGLNSPPQGLLRKLLIPLLRTEGGGGRGGGDDGGDGDGVVKEGEYCEGLYREAVQLYNQVTAGKWDRR